MFGDWVFRRRRLLGLTQDDLARKVNCSVSMLRKIEADERRPSRQLAELLADQLAIDDSHRAAFIQLARGKLIQDIAPIIDIIDTSNPLVTLRTDRIVLNGEHAPFVARERQLKWLNEQLDIALQGHGRMVFIAGEAGRGKSSLLIEFARMTTQARSDLILAGGSCDIYTGQGDPLLPFRNIFRMLVGDFENNSLPGIVNRELATRLDRAVPDITKILLDQGPHLIDTLVPANYPEARLSHSLHHQPENAELLLRLQGSRAWWASLPEQETRQDHLFEEISSVLNAISQQHPMLLLLDDLHWIDPSSAALLGHLAMRLKQSPVLIVGAYRPEDLAGQRDRNDVGGRAQHPLQEVLSETLRQFGQNRVDLDHSEPGEELEFVNAFLDLLDNQFGDAFRKQLATLTEGHPLFLVELLQEMRDRGDIILAEDGRWQECDGMSWEILPARVEGVIEKRIGRLTDDLRELLNIASVNGETFFAEVVARIGNTDPVQLTRRLDAELDRKHRLIREQGVTHDGVQRLSHYRFRHHLFQKYLYGRLGAAERMYLHEAVGSALEALVEPATRMDDFPAAQLAWHFKEARLGLKAGKYLLLAGRQAARVLAFDEAAAHFEGGLSELKYLARTAEIDDLEFELTLALARSLWHSGRVIEAVDAYQAAIALARSIDDPMALARAALAYEDPRWRLNLDAALSRQYMREALAALSDEPSAIRARLLVGLSRSLLVFGEKEELHAMVDQALAITRQIGDPLALVDALRIKIHIDRRPETTGARLAAIREMITTAESIHDRERLADAYDLYVYELLEIGQIDLADEMIEAQRQVAHESKQPFQMHVAAVFQTMRAIMRGEFDRAERLANEAADFSRQMGLAELDGIFGIHMFTIRREQGRLNEVAPVVKHIAAQTPDRSAWRPGLALIYCHLDLREECRAIFEVLAADGFASVPQDSLWVATLAYLAEVCAYLGDVERAETLYRLLLPYDGRTVIVGGATACFGAAARYLGMLARTRSDCRSAERHFQAAIEMDQRMRAWPWLAHSKFEYAALLLARGEKYREQANELLADTLTAAQGMNMQYLARQVATLQAKHDLATS